MSRKLTVRLLRAAENDLDEIISFVAADNPKAASILAAKIEAGLSRLGLHPLLGKIAKEEALAKLGYRYLIVQNYLLFYTCSQQVVLIHRIVHGARDYLNLL